MSRLQLGLRRPYQWPMLTILLLSVIAISTLFNIPVKPTNIRAQPASIAQSWIHRAGSCDPNLKGAILGLPSTGCGGNTTSFDSHQIYSPAVLKDLASIEAPCPGIANGAICYRMWYVGENASNTPRIGLAVSPDGKSWTRVPGTGTGGSTFDLAATGAFDSQGVSYLSVMKDAGVFKMWYSGYGAAHGLDLTEGIGYAISTDGQHWTRIAGPLQGGAVLRASAQPGTFDQHESYVPFVIKDQATADMPCGSVALGNSCYRMWYEGANTSAGYRFLIGYAVSGDGIHWTRLVGPGSGGAVLDQAASAAFDDNSVGIAQVIKEGNFLRMWYEAKNYNPGAFSIGHVSSEDGISWIRPSSHAPVFTGADDPATASPDYIWSHSVLKDGASYHMWYSMSIRPGSTRIGYASMTAGTTMQSSITSLADRYKLSFTTTQAIPAGSIILITPPAGIGLQPGLMQGFDALVQTASIPAAITDAAAAQVAREALIITFQNDEAPGIKTIELIPSSTIVQASEITIQTFKNHAVLEYSLVKLPGLSTPTATNTPTTTNTPTPTSTPIIPSLPFSIRLPLIIK